MELLWDERKSFSFSQLLVNTYILMWLDPIALPLIATNQRVVAAKRRQRGFKPFTKLFYWLFQGGTSFVDLLCFCSVLCLLCLCACLFICAMWSPAKKKGLTSWLSLVLSSCEFVTFPLVSWIRCGTWLYRFLIFAPVLTLVAVTTRGSVLFCSSAIWRPEVTFLLTVPRWYFFICVRLWHIALYVPCSLVVTCWERG